MKHRVSGVPYTVELDDFIAVLEHENRCLLARNERLEGEVKALEARVKVLEQECNWLESRTREIKHDGYVSGNH